MKTRLHLLLSLTLFCLSPLVQAGTPDHMMWVATKQDALILGEVLEQSPDRLSKVKIMAVFPQTHFFWLGSGSSITFEDGSEYPQNLQIGGEYPLSSY